MTRKYIGITPLQREAYAQQASEALVRQLAENETQEVISPLNNAEEVIIFAPTGRIISKGVNELREAISEQLPDDAKDSKLLFDLADVSALDSSGLGVFMTTHIAVAQKGGRIAIINVGNNIKNLIIRSRLINTFEHFNSEDEAVLALTADS